MTDTDLVRWKSDAWKNPEMVSWYSQRMVESNGTRRFKNQLETDLCAAHVAGNEILDVGIGTGRASLPLARRGFAVTGTDNSQAMLDECRRLAGDTPISLRLGEVGHLPFQDAQFDTLLSLNVVVHFPHWREFLKEWRRVVRPGGRIVFDVHSLDNYRVARGTSATEANLVQAAQQEQGFAEYMLRVAVSDMVAEASANDLTVVGIIPYGAFLGGGNVNYLVDDLERKSGWQRLLSWFATDGRLYDFAMFLEREFISRLTSVLTGRYMVVLENRPDSAANRQWLARNSEINRALAGADSFEHIVPFLKKAPAEFLAEFNAHLSASPRNFVFFYDLCRELRKSRPGLRLDTFLDQAGASRVEDWQRQEQADRDALEMIRTWHREPKMKESLERHGVPLGESLEYFLMERILTDYAGIFSGVKS